MECRVLFRKLYRTVSRFVESHRALPSVLIVCASIAAHFVFKDDIAFTNPEEAFVPRGFGDQSRFVSQAVWLLEGRGFLGYSLNPTPTTANPPGYSVFLAALLALSGSLTFIIYVQVGLHAAAGILVMQTLRRWHPVVGFGAGLVLASSPWIANQASRFMSEIFGLFLAALIAALVARADPKRLSFAAYVLIGGLLSAWCLTVPAVVIVAAALTLGLVWKLRDYKKLVGALVLGWALPMSIWQVHCINVQGRPVPTMLTTFERPTLHGYFSWLSGWARSPKDAVWAHNTFLWRNPGPGYDRIPAYAYRDSAQRARIESIATEIRNPTEIMWKVPGWERLDAEFQRAADLQDKEAPMARYFAFLVRSLRLWGDVPKIKYITGDGIILRKISPDGQQVGGIAPKGTVVNVAGIIHHILVLGLMMVALYTAVRRRSILGIGVLVGVLGYTYLAASLDPDYRRNLPFWPIIISSLVFDRRGLRLQPEGKP